MLAEITDPALIAEFERFKRCEKRQVECSLSDRQVNNRSNSEPPERFRPWLTAAVDVLFERAVSATKSRSRPAAYWRARYGRGDPGASGDREGPHAPGMAEQGTTPCAGSLPGAAR